MKRKRSNKISRALRDSRRDFFVAQRSLDQSNVHHSLAYDVTKESNA